MMISSISTLSVLLALSGCCLGATISSGTGETVDSASSGGAGTAAVSGTAGAATGGTGTTAGTTGTGTTTGMCGSATLTVSPSSIDFGYVPLLSNSIRCTTLSNPCNALVMITGVGSFDNQGGSFGVATTDHFPITIDGGDDAQVCFSFDCPVTGDYAGQATLVIGDSEDTNPVVRLTGRCGGPQIGCAPLTLAFGSVLIGQSSTLSVTCTNNGSTLSGFALTIGPLDAGSGVFSAAFDPTTNPYPDGGLQPGQSTQIDVSYAPIDQADDFGVLAIPNNGGQGQTPYISLSGRGY